MQSHSEHPTRYQSDRMFLIIVLFLFFTIMATLFISGFFAGRTVERHHINFDLKLKNTVLITKES